MAWKETGLPCPSCPSSDAYAINDEGWGKCFSCDTNVPPDGERKATKTKTAKGLVTGLTFKELAKREISEKTCRKFGYGVAEHRGKTVQVAPYADAAGNVVAQKLRYADKSFQIVGDFGKAGLFGQHLWGSNGKRVVITEGEIDALSYAQVTSLTWPVVSVPNGASGARKAIVKAGEWLASFEQVVFLFDNDEPGREAAQECAEALPPGKARIAKLPRKDANEMLLAGEVKELLQAVWNAEPFRPEGLHKASFYREAAKRPAQWGLSWPWESLTNATYGRRRGEMYGFGAGSGVGKTDTFTQIMAHIMDVDKLPVGVIPLEQVPQETLKRIAGKRSGKQYHIPDEGWTQEELDRDIDQLCDSDLCTILDAYGCTEWDVVSAKIRHMVQAEGIKDIFLDHLTALATGKSKPEKDILEEIMGSMSSMVKELDFSLYYISHLTTPDGTPHEEGGRVMGKHFKGSRAILFWTHFLFGAERDTQAEDPEERKRTLIRVLKDRNTGRGTGQTVRLQYDVDTGLLNEEAAPPPQETADAFAEADADF